MVNLEPKKWYFNTKEEANNLIILLNKVLSYPLVYSIMKECYEEVESHDLMFRGTNTLWYYLHDQYVKGFLISGETHDIKNLKIIVERNLVDNKLKVIWSNYPHFHKKITLTNDFLLCIGKFRTYVSDNMLEPNVVLRCFHYYRNLKLQPLYEKYF